MNSPTLVAFLLLAVTQAQTLRQAQTPRSTGAPVPYTIESNLPTQKVGVDDLILVSVVDCPELTGTFRVAANGTLPLPVFKQSMESELRRYLKVHLCKFRAWRDDGATRSQVAIYYESRRPRNARRDATRLGVAIFSEETSAAGLRS